MVGNLSLMLGKLIFCFLTFEPVGNFHLLDRRGYFFFKKIIPNWSMIFQYSNFYLKGNYWYDTKKNL